MTRDLHAIAVKLARRDRLAAELQAADAELASLARQRGFDTRQWGYGVQQMRREVAAERQAGKAAA